MAADQFVGILVTSALVTPMGMAVIDLSPCFALAQRGLFHTLKIRKLRTIIHCDRLKDLGELSSTHAAFQRIKGADNTAGRPVTHTDDHFLAAAAFRQDKQRRFKPVLFGGINSIHLPMAKGYPVIYLGRTVLNAGAAGYPLLYLLFPGSVPTLLLSL